MAAKKYLSIASGITTEVQATVVSAGAGDDGDIVALGSDGRLDLSVMPSGVGPDTKSIEASENLSAGDYVNVHDSSGAKVRKADNSNNRPAVGFVKDAVTSGQQALVYFEGINDDKSSLTIGGRCYLSTTGGVTQTAPTTGISQFLGVAVSATEISTEIADHIVLA